MPDAANQPIAVKLQEWKEINLPAGVLAVHGSPDDKQLFAGCLDGTVHQVEIESGKTTELGRHRSFASGARFLRKANQLITAGYDGVLNWHDCAGKRIVRTVQAHQFWSWKMRVSPDERLVASATGQYLAGGYKYEPAAEREPGVKVLDAETGVVRHEFSHLPPVLSLAFTSDSRFLAAGNMMGDIRVWELATGRQVASFNTPDFTSWGIIKSNHYIGGISDLVFSPDDRRLFACGTGPMGDPMAGNGRQTWQEFDWREGRRTRQIADGDGGNGLMESIVFHPAGRIFLMGGRLAQGKWNVALFDVATGRAVHSLDTKMRVTDSHFFDGGKALALSGALQQEKKKAGKYPDFGRIRLYRCLGA